MRLDVEVVFINNDAETVTRTVCRVQAIEYSSMKLVTSADTTEELLLVRYIDERYSYYTVVWSADRVLAIKPYIVTE